jgi:hypothetical protein
LTNPQVRVLESVREGEALTVPYVNMLARRESRRKQLLESKHFLCQCSRYGGWSLLYAAPSQGIVHY